MTETEGARPQVGRRGRRALPETDRLRRYSVRLRGETFAAACRVARRRGLDPAVFMRQAISEKVEREAGREGR